MQSDEFRHSAQKLPVLQKTNESISIRCRWVFIGGIEGKGDMREWISLAKSVAPATCGLWRVGFNQKDGDACYSREKP